MKIFSNLPLGVVGDIFWGVIGCAVLNSGVLGFVIGVGKRVESRGDFLRVGKSVVPGSAVPGFGVPLMLSFTNFHIILNPLYGVLQSAFS